MNPNPAESDTVLPADVAELLNRTPAITSALRERLARAAEEADRDPVFHANYLKGLVSQEILQALAERGETQSSLAERLGCTRQYLNKLLSEDRRVNFTLDTICSLAHLTGRRAHLVFVREDEEPHVLRCAKPRAVHRLRDELGSTPDQRRIHALDSEFEIDQPLTTHAHDSSCAAA